MKQIFLSYVMICSLLLAVSGCAGDLGLQQGPNSEFPGKPDIDHEDEGNNSLDSSGEQGLNEPELPEVDPAEAGSPEDELPGDDPAETELPEATPPEVEPPEFVDFCLFSKKEIHFNFSSAVNNISCTFTPHQEIDCIQDGKTVKVFLKENLGLQTNFLVELNVKDDWENSLSVEVPLFVNDWIPKIEINELRTEYSSSAKRAEFIEFKVKSAGELNGLQLYIMWSATKPYVFDLPGVDVKLGEYVTFHLRTLESCVNELGEDLSESAGTDSCPTARDLWVPGNAELLHKTDIVYLQDANGGILDAVILNEEPGEAWKKNQAHFAEIAEDLYNKGAWKSADGQLPGPYDAVDTSTIKTSATKSISRYEGKENTHTKEDWYITGASPGQPNN